VLTNFSCLEDIISVKRKEGGRRHHIKRVFHRNNGEEIRSTARPLDMDTVIFLNFVFIIIIVTPAVKIRRRKTELSTVEWVIWGQN
jgi:hypothetical protein